jgi:hypothetical protein
MNITDFNPTGKTKLGKMNKLLKEQFGIKLNGAPERTKLERVMETADRALIKIRGSQKKFHLDPEYIKFLGIRDAAETMLHEGNYVKSPAYEAMANSLRTTIQELMDAGYSKDDACAETMNRARMNGAWAFAEDVMSPIIASAATQYVAEYEVANDPALVEYDAASNMTDALIAEMARELGMKVEDTETLSAIAEKISMFAEVSGRSSEAIVEFLNGLNEADMVSGIQMFGRKVASENKFAYAAKQAKAQGKKEFELDGEKFPVKEAQEAAMAGDASMFNDIIDSILNEEVDVEQAEVVMAVRSLADDVQSQIERISDMMNKDVPAIADQMRAEQGASQAQQFSDTMSSTLGTYLESAKACKSGVDSQVMTLSGEAGADMAGLGDTSMDGMDAPADSDMDLDAPVDTNDPVASGPENEPLGRAEV